MKIKITIPFKIIINILNLSLICCLERLRNMRIIMQLKTRRKENLKEIRKLVNF